MSVEESVQPTRTVQPISEDRARVYALGLAALGGLLLMNCSWEHWCMCGHLAHPPYSVNPFAVDYGWRVALVLSLLLALRSNMASRGTFYLLVVLAVLLCNFLGSLLGCLSGFALVLFCLRALWKSRGITTDAVVPADDT